MNQKKVSLDAVKNTRIAILGYGNQGRAQALNLRDSGINLVVGCRQGDGFNRAVIDGFEPCSVEEAVIRSELVMFLLPDQIIPGVYGFCREALQKGAKTIGFAHGFALHYGFLEIHGECSYLLVAPRSAGAILRDNFMRGVGTPGVFALGPNSAPETRALCMSYAVAVGLKDNCLFETTFQEETECDLFGEQAVLCGGIMQLMEKAFEILVKNGLNPQTAFIECCFEARLILELWMKYGPEGLSRKISPTAFYGGMTRGRRLVNEETERELEKIFGEIRDGTFAREWMDEVEAGTPNLKKERERLKSSLLEKVYSEMSGKLL